MIWAENGSILGLTQAGHPMYSPSKATIASNCVATSRAANISLDGMGWRLLDLSGG